METPKPEHLDSTVWINPMTGRPMPGAPLRAEVGPDKIPGVCLGDRPTIFPFVEGVTAEGARQHAFYMNGPDGQPMVGIREVPNKSEPARESDS